MAKFLTNIDLSKNQLQNALLHPLATAPSSPSAGQVYFNTGSKKLFLYDGSKWIEIGAIDGAGILTLINGQQGKIDLKNLDLGVFTNTKDGLVPKTGTPSGKFLKDDGSWAALPDTTVEIVDNLTTDSSAKALSAKQGKTLKDDLDNRVKTNVPANAKFTDTVTTVVDNLTSTSATSALSAKQGKMLGDTLSALLQLVEPEFVDVGDRGDFFDAAEYLKDNELEGYFKLTYGDVSVFAISAEVEGIFAVVLFDPLFGVAQLTWDFSEEDWTMNIPFVQLPELVGALEGLDIVTEGGVKEYIDTGDSAAKSYADTKAGLAETAANQYTDTEIANLVGSSPEALDTLEELAAALGSDPNFATTVTNQLALKIDKYAANVGGSTSQVITHNLNSRDVIVRLFQNAAPYAEVYCDIERTSVNTVTLKFAKAPTANEYRVVITG